VIPLNQPSKIPHLLKYCVHKEIESLICENNPEALQ